MREKMEMEQLNTMIQDLKQKRSASSTFHSIVQACFPPDTPIRGSWIQTL